MSDENTPQIPQSLKRSISPPPCRSSRKRRKSQPEPTLAAVEAGQAIITNHLEYFHSKLSQLIRPPTYTPRLSITDFKHLYQRNQNPHGRHFVVHQHQHPIAGVHYDLRLQFSRSSSLSWALPYGLPGAPNSSRPNRMAIETRVHCVWNHLIESASHATGSLLIWDTGEYEVLPREAKAVETDDERTDGEGEVEEGGERVHENERLIGAFRDRHIRLRLHGTRLPSNYTIYMRLPRHNDTPSTPRKRRRRKGNGTSSPSTSAENRRSQRFTSPLSSDPEPSTPDSAEPLVQNDSAIATASDTEDAQTVLTNAYPGATNSIGSIHQRRWFLGLDRANSGFKKATKGAEKGKWIKGADGGGFDAFYVRGSEVERSIVTGRKAKEVLEDDGVEGFVERKMWRAVLE